MTSRDPESDTIIPLIAEELTVAKRSVETGRVRVHTRVESSQHWVRDAVARDHVTVERVAVGREVTSVPAVREEEGVTIVPVVEEVLHIEKRLVLVEEIRIRKLVHVEPIEHSVTLRRAIAEVEHNQP